MRRKEGHVHAQGPFRAKGIEKGVVGEIVGRVPWLVDLRPEGSLSSEDKEEDVMSASAGSVAKSMEGCVMLALSTFRRSEKAVEVALGKARESGKLVIVYVADLNLARYFIGGEQGYVAGLRDSCEAELLKKHEAQGWEHVNEIAAKAEDVGLVVEKYVQVGRFGVVCLDVVGREKPACVVTTRSNRPEWVRKFFGAPVDEVVAKAGCPVIIV